MHNILIYSGIVGFIKTYPSSKIVNLLCSSFLNLHIRKNLYYYYCLHLFINISNQSESQESLRTHVLFPCKDSIILKLFW